MLHYWMDHVVAYGTLGSAFLDSLLHELVRGQVLVTKVELNLFHYRRLLFLGQLCWGRWR